MPEATEAAPHPRQWDITTVTGKEWWIITFAPRRVAIRHVAKLAVKVYGGPCPESPLFFHVPGWPRLEVLNVHGDTRIA
jgi:hypothetical protein